jgi:NDP-sugar pyrophosphorylase family protein|tara:strand:+ start:2867 stop:3562 length:696 start_codon:yes stop_codon:yes gene_type:complete
MKPIDLVILAGGKGKRLRSITKNKIPKPLVKINNIPFLDYLINYLSRFGIRKIIILCGYKGNQIYKRYNNTKVNGKIINCKIEKKEMGTGGALNLIKNKISKYFFLVNGDTFFNINLDNLKKKMDKNYSAMMVLSTEFKKSKTKKLLNLKLNNKSELINKKSKLINSGTYLFSNKIFEYLNTKNQSLESEIIPILIKKKRIFGVKSRAKLIDIGTPNNYKISKYLLSKQNF